MGAASAMRHALPNQAIRAKGLPTPIDCSTPPQFRSSHTYWTQSEPMTRPSSRNWKRRSQHEDDNLSERENYDRDLLRPPPDSMFRVVLPCPPRARSSEPQSFSSACPHLRLHAASMGLPDIDCSKTRP